MNRIQYNTGWTKILNVFEAEGEVVIPEGVVEICDNAFEDCNLESVVFPSTLEYIGNKAFSNCFDLKKVDIPGNVKKIGNEAFSNCIFLKEILFHEGLEEIGDCAFLGTTPDCVVLPRSLKRIGNLAIPDPEISYIGIRNGVEEIGKDALSFNKVMHIPSTIKKMGKLDLPENLIIEEGLEALDAPIYLSTEQQSSTIVKVPRSLQGVCPESFLRLYADFRVDSDHPYLCAYHSSNILLKKDSEYLDKVYQYIIDQNIPLDVSGTERNEGNRRVLMLKWFDPINYRTSFRIPKVDIKQALANSSNLFIDLPLPLDPSVTVYISKRFHGRGIGISDTWEYVDYQLLLPKDSKLGCFCWLEDDGGSSVLHIASKRPKYGIVPPEADLRHIPEEAGKLILCIESRIDNCLITFISELYHKRIQDVRFGTYIPTLTFKDGVLYDREEKLVLMSIGEKDITILDGMKRICPFAFHEAENIKLPSSIEIIDCYAFFNSALKTINLSEGVKSIGKRAFSYCYSLEEIVLPETLEELGEEAFYDSYRLKNINIPPSVKVIKNHTFYCCDNLQTITINEGVAEICHNAFELTGLRAVKLPDSITGIGTNVFDGCEHLETVETEVGIVKRGTKLFTEFLNDVEEVFNSLRD